LFYLINPTIISNTTLSLTCNKYKILSKNLVALWKFRAVYVHVVVPW